MTIIKIDEEIGYWGISARDIKDKLEEATGDITIEINSPGGNVVEGISIFNAIKDYDRGQVIVIIVGIAASMASYIALAGDKVKAYDNAIYMIHNASGIVAGDYREMENYSKKLYSLSAILKRGYIDKTNKSEKEIQSLMDDETYFFGNEMLDYGFIDEIIATGKEENQSEQVALAKETFNACMINVQKNAKKEEPEQIAAILEGFEKKETLRVNSASAKIENKKEGESMSIKETYTAEEFSALEATQAEALTTAKEDAIASEKKRVVEILALSGCQDTKVKAIEDGLSAGECAIELNKKFSVQAIKEKTDFEAASNEVENISTGAESGQEKTAEQLAIEADDEAFYKAKKGEK